LYSFFEKSFLGDFGGPAFQWMNDHWEQIGIASFTSDGCKTNSIVGYTRLAYYHDWIIENIRSRSETTENPTSPIYITTQNPTTTYECDKHTVSCGCGRRHVQVSYSNNYEAVPYSWSTIVSIRLNHQSKHSCSGSILSEYYILTSASCLANASSYGITIVAGIHNHSEDSGIYRKVDQIFFHPNYLGPVNNHAHDIAILHVTERLPLADNLFLNQICLPQKYNALPDSIFYPAPGARLLVIGWGLMNCVNQTEQQLLQQIQLSAMSNTEKSCSILDNHKHIQFCAGLYGGSTG
jgi:secreted trypsin-like serine protease